MRIQTKGDLVLAALRKIGVASDATTTDIEPQSLEDAVNDLEMMIAEWLKDGISSLRSYQFSSTDSPPDDGDPHGLDNSTVSAVVHNLALRIAPDYHVAPTDKVISTARYGKERLIKQCTLQKAYRYRYPARMPIGSGNRWASAINVNFFMGETNVNPTDPTDEGAK